MPFGDPLTVLTNRVLGSHASTLPCAAGQVGALGQVVDRDSGCGRPI
jgi:hypothetical protein